MQKSLQGLSLCSQTRGGVYRRLCGELLEAGARGNSLMCSMPGVSQVHHDLDGCLGETQCTRGKSPHYQNTE